MSTLGFVGLRAMGSRLLHEVLAQLGPDPALANT
jgi:hypothetical protein